MMRAAYFSLILASAIIGGCDTFFHVSTVVVDAHSGLPVPDASVTLVLDKGAGEPDITKTTGIDGAFNIAINEPENAWATLTVEKDGYGTWTTQFRGSPRCVLVIRLEPQETGREQGITVPSNN